MFYYLAHLLHQKMEQKLKIIFKVILLTLNKEIKLGTLFFQSDSNLKTH